MKKILVLSILSSVVMAVSAQAQESPTSKYFTIQSVRTVEVATETFDFVPNEVKTLISPQRGFDFLLGGVDVTQIINLGKQAWDLIVANRPVINISVDTANALPRGIQSWDNLAQWQAPIARIFRSTFVNGYGMNVIDLTYRIHYTHGGSFNGQGHYLTNVSVEPADLSVAWGYKFGMNASVPNITNAGSRSNPIAAAEVLLKWQVDTMVKHEEQSASFYIRGDGGFQDLTNGNSK